MKRILRYRLLLAVIIAGLLLSVAGCGAGAGGSGAAEEKPTIVATIFPVADIIRQVGGNAVEVVSLIPPGASPHTFEPTPGQMTEVAAASAFITVGAGLDDWAATLGAAGARDLVQVQLTDGLELLRSHQGGDPHIWLDPLLVRDHVVPVVTGVLIGLVPEQEAELTARAEAYRRDLEALDEEIRQDLAGLENPCFIAFHPAWGYFAARYDLVQVAAVEPAPGKEPSARWVAQVVETARRAHAVAVMTEPQFSPQAAEVIARECDAELLIVDPLGGAGLDGRDSYQALMRFNAAVFRDGLQ